MHIDRNGQFKNVKRLKRKAQIFFKPYHKWTHKFYGIMVMQE